MSQQPISNFTDTSMQNLKKLIDVNTIIGEPITTSSGITVIPFSKVSFGYGGGGSDLPSDSTEKFAGGSGAGVTINPLGFIIIKDGNVEIKQLDTAKNTNDRLVNASANVVDKILDLIPKKSVDPTDNVADIPEIPLDSGAISLD